MRRAILWSLLALVPFTNLGMICFDHAGSGAALKADAPDCVDLCLREQAPARESESEQGCFLVADDECSLMSAMVSALTPGTPRLIAPAAYAFSTRRPQVLYLPPALEIFSPPPQL